MSKLAKLLVMTSAYLVTYFMGTQKEMEYCLGVTMFLYSKLTSMETIEKV